MNKVIAGLKRVNHTLGVLGVLFSIGWLISLFVLGGASTFLKVALWIVLLMYWLLGEFIDGYEKG